MSETNETGSGALIGVDVGGTHTDAIAFLGELSARGKALTTYDDFSRGVLQAVEVAAEGLGTNLRDLLARTQLFVNGTTVVTNALTELRGAKVGVFVTSGFKDTFRFAGGLRQAAFDDHLQQNVPDLVDRQVIVETAGRIDYSGSEVVTVDRDQISREARRLVEEHGVETIAVCFLWSHLNPAHELAVEEELTKLYPDMFVSLSHRVFPVQGENRRWTTALLNCFVHDQARRYLDRVSSKLRDSGLRGRLAFFQGLGGMVSAEQAAEFPMSLLGSGPAGGAFGANELAGRLGHSDVLIADMGGTSFDTGIITDNQLHIEKNIDLGPFKTGVNLVDVVSIGAGGGSIAWVSERGVLQVGPHSAGPNPGPACYDKGGASPTVTDALVAMGLIDPDNYLGGRTRLRPELAAEALEKELAHPFGWFTEQAAAAVYRLAVTNMANAIREVSVQKGYDPRDFLFVAYGGTLPLFAAELAEELNIGTIVLPLNSSVFCARGLVGADFVLRRDHDASWLLTDPSGVDRVNAVAARMVDAVREDMRREGFSEDEISVSRSGDFRFMGQVFELSMPLPAKELTAADGPVLSDQFVSLYERTYGRGTPWTGVPTMLVNYTVTASAGRSTVSMSVAPQDPREPGEIAKGERDVYLPSTQENSRVPVYDGALFTVGSRVVGPAIVDESDTTIYVPPRVTVERDHHLNYVLHREGTER